MFKKPEMKPSLCLHLTLCFPASETLKIDLIEMEESHNRIYPSIIPLLRMHWCVVRRRRQGGLREALWHSCGFAPAVLALDSVLAPPHAANLSISNQPPASLLIFCFLSPTGLLSLRFFPPTGSIAPSNCSCLPLFSRPPFPWKCHSHVWKIELNLADHPHPSHPPVFTAFRHVSLTLTLHDPHISKESHQKWKIMIFFSF